MTRDSRGRFARAGEPEDRAHWRRVGERVRYRCAVERRLQDAREFWLARGIDPRWFDGAGTPSRYAVTLGP